MGTCVVSVDSDVGDVNKVCGYDKILSIQSTYLQLEVISLKRESFLFISEI